MVQENSEGSLRYLLLRYFAHGLLFSIFGLFIGLLWAVILVALFVIGSFIGLIIGFIILFFAFGWANAFLLERIWNVRVKTYWMSLLGHGIALVVAFLVIHIPSIIISIYAPSLPTTITLLIIYCFIDGYVARTVGSYWKEEGGGPEATGRAPIELSFTATLIVLVVTGLAGTGFVVSLLLLVWIWTGGTLVESLLYLTGITGVLFFAGVIILSLSRRSLEEEE